MLACTALVGCTNEDVIDNPNENPVLNGEKAYMAVSIKNAGAASRGTGTTNPEFSDGLTTENNVESAHFFFYDENGTYITKSAPGTTFKSLDSANDNTEEVSDAIVVLQGLDGKDYPDYVVAVLNASNDIVSKVENQPLSKLKDILAGDIKNGNNFIMSNSTYNNNDSKSQYFATKVVPANFSVEEPEYNNDGTLKTEGLELVKIYVERLAVKTQLSVSSEANDENDGRFKLTKYNVDGAQKELYVNIKGWGLNGTTKDSRLMKNVPAFNAFTTDDGGNAWDWTNVSYRTYWGHSYNYGIGKYPQSSEVDPGQTTGDSEWTLNYYSWNSLAKTLNDVDYCPENTNTKTLLEANFHATATEILVKANIEDAAGNGVTLIRYNNLLYTTEGYINQVLVNLNKKGQYWKYSDWGTSNWSSRELSFEDVEYVNLGNGNVKVRLKNVTRNEETDEIIDVPLKTVVKPAEGEEYTVYGYYSKAVNGFNDATADNTDDVLDGAGNVINPIPSTDIKSLDNLIEEISQAECYNGGMMYYNIPIEHLRGGKAVYNTTTDATSRAQTTTITINEGDYGVVRNHYYQTIINKVENLGTAVYDPNEIIVPNNEDKETYFIGASVYILSWKIVKQNVDL